MNHSAKTEQLSSVSHQVSRTTDAVVYLLATVIFLGLLSKGVYALFDMDKDSFFYQTWKLF